MKENNKKVYDYSKLNGRITEKFKMQANFAKKLGLSEHTLSKKLTNKSTWKQDEIDNAVNLLELSSDDIPAYFFASYVQHS